ncbi:MAG: FAD-binding protein [Verrucomicrobia bacterium]|nr:FAD-binding protein [Verrucomicrobiota bacterium]
MPLRLGTTSRGAGGVRSPDHARRRSEPAAHHPRAALVAQAAAPHPAQRHERPVPALPHRCRRRRRAQGSAHVRPRQHRTRLEARTAGLRGGADPLPRPRRRPRFGALLGLRPQGPAPVPRPALALAVRPAYDFVIVGAGFSGLVIAERLGAAGHRCLVVEKRDHIGGNCHDRHDRNGLLYHVYGPHYFRTNSAVVREYLSRFTAWREVKYRVQVYTQGRYWSLPVNLATYRQLCGRADASETEFKDYLARAIIPCEHPANSRDAMLACVGPELYELFFRGTRSSSGAGPPRRSMRQSAVASRGAPTSTSATSTMSFRRCRATGTTGSSRICTPPPAPICDWRPITATSFPTCTANTWCTPGRSTSTSGIVTVRCPIAASACNSRSTQRPTVPTGCSSPRCR